MTIHNPTGRNIVKSPSYIQSMGFDPDFEMPAVEILGYEPVGQTLNRIKVNSDGELVANLETGDIEIGAVEIKNSTDDTRATVDAYGLATKATVAETAPTDATKVNPSTAYSYDGDGNLQYKDKTIGATTYRKTYTYTDGVLTAQSAYVAI